MKTLLGSRTPEPILIYDGFHPSGYQAHLYTTYTWWWCGRLFFVGINLYLSDKKLELCPMAPTWTHHMSVFFWCDRFSSNPATIFLMDCKTHFWKEFFFFSKHLRRFKMANGSRRLLCNVFDINDCALFESQWMVSWRLPSTVLRQFGFQGGWNVCLVFGMHSAVLPSTVMLRETTTLKTFQLRKNRTRDLAPSYCPVQLFRFVFIIFVPVFCRAWLKKLDFVEQIFIFCSFPSVVLRVIVFPIGPFWESFLYGKTKFGSSTVAIKLRILRTVLTGNNCRSLESCLTKWYSSLILPRRIITGFHCTSLMYISINFLVLSSVRDVRKQESWEADLHYGLIVLGLNFIKNIPYTKALPVVFTAHWIAPWKLEIGRSFSATVSGAMQMSNTDDAMILSGYINRECWSFN